MQEQIKRARQASQDTLQCAICPAAVFVLVRPERNSVRFELRQRPAPTAILRGFEELGWPATLGESAAARSGLTSFPHAQSPNMGMHAHESNLPKIPLASVSEMLGGHRCPAAWQLPGTIQTSLGVSNACTAEYLAALKSCAVSEASCGGHLRLQHSRLRSSARSQLLLIRHLYGPYLEQDTSQPVFATVQLPLWFCQLHSVPLLL